MQSTGDTVTVTLDEVLHLETDIPPAAVVGAFTLTADGIDLGIQIISPLGLGQNLSISLTSGTTIYAGQTVKLSYDKTAAGADALKDAAGNEVVSFTDFPVTNNSEIVPDTPGPDPESAVVDSGGNAVTLTFDEALDSAVATLPAAVVDAFTLTADGVALGIQSAVINGATTLTINLPSGTTIYAGQTVKLSYDKTAAGADALEDADGNEAASFTDFRVANNSEIVPDTTPPSPESAAVPSAGDRVTLIFDEALDSAVQILPAAVIGAFTLTADGVALGIQRAVINGTTTLTINFPSGTEIYAGQTVKLSYDKTEAGAEALEDAAGNEVAGFTDFAVTNNSIVGIPEITIASGQDVTEGTAAVFTLTRSGATTDPLAVAVTVSESGEMIAAENEGSHTVSFVAGSATATLSIPTQADTAHEDYSAVTAALVADSSIPPAYVPGAPDSVVMTIIDDDAPTSTLLDIGASFGSGTQATGVDVFGKEFDVYIETVTDVTLTNMQNIIPVNDIVNGTLGDVSEINARRFKFPVTATGEIVTFVIQRRVLCGPPAAPTR